MPSPRPDRAGHHWVAGVEMRRRLTRTLLPLGAVLMAALLIGCEAGDARYTAETPAGFLMGLWHGIISVITLIIGIFSDSVKVYEVHNTGGWYDFGFLLGVIMIWGSGARASKRKKERRSGDAPWKSVGQSIQQEIEKQLRTWADAEPDEDWDEVERRLKRKLREWRDDEDDDGVVDVDDEDAGDDEDDGGENDGGDSKRGSREGA